MNNMVGLKIDMWNIYNGTHEYLYSSDVSKIQQKVLLLQGDNKSL